ncbi:MAG: translation initiation factor IF-2 [Fimbriimonadaceae bacterium]|nr:translation initiation factor IF-2 [Fimbriimonadaceae bacterium]
MAQETVADLAKEFRMGVQEALDLLVGLGVEVEAATSQVEEADAEIFRELVAEERRQVREQAHKQRRRQAGDLLAGEVRLDERTAEEVAEAKAAADTSAIEIPATVSLRQFAEIVKENPGSLMLMLQADGKPASINMKFSAEDAISLAAERFNLRLRKQTATAAPEPVKKTTGRKGVDPVPPVVTVMGHVDHGKTTLLDTIRHANVVSGEAGGITQHIGAYQVEHNGHKITFIDTPGHEAFTDMRARGAKVTDIVVLVIAADDGVMPQTVEAINHAKAAQVPILVAVNKCDVQGADPQRAKQQLLEYNLIAEDFGGEVICVETSAKVGTGVGDLLDSILLVAEVEELSGNPRLNPVGTVIEAHLDKGRGPVASVLVRDGTLKKGDSLVVGTAWGRVRTMLDHLGREITSAGPSTPVEVLGLSEVPAVGEPIEVAKNEKRARKLAEDYASDARDEVTGAPTTAATLEDFLAQVQAGEVDKLNVVLKADVQGSIEAILHKLAGFKTSDVAVDVKHSAVGPISKSDVDLAKTTGSILIGFNTSVEPQVRALADDEGVEIRLYAVIYQLLDDLRQALEGMLAPEVTETVLGHADVLQVFKISGVGNIAGCKVSDGWMRRNESVRVFRAESLIFDGKLTTLKRIKEMVSEVIEGLECGIHLTGYRDIKPGDRLECYTVTETARSLDL